jgi:hypothetical protein
VGGILRNRALARLCGRRIDGVDCRDFQENGAMTSRNKPGVAFWATVVVTLVLLYVASFGPAIWLTARGYFRDSAVQSVYMPVLWSAAQAESLENVVTWWGSLGVPDGKAVNMMFETDDALSVFQFTRTGEEIPLHP